jgi:putative membrane protein
MLLQWGLAALHLLALGIGIGAIWERGRALRALEDQRGLKRVFLADSLWGLAAFLWISTGIVRVFGGMEKGTAYYMTQPMFHIKMALLALILMLEIWPMVTLVRWRIGSAKGGRIDLSPARRFATISSVQLVLTTLMVVAATALARNIRP